MVCALRYVVFALGLVLAWPQIAFAHQVEVIVSRSSDYIELFFSARSDVLLDVFGLDPRAVTDESGAVDFPRLRLGTFEIADDLVSGVTPDIGGKPLVLEGMSLMLHPIQDRLPFETPVDGLVSIAVCSVPDPGNAAKLETTWGYVGYYADTDRPDAALSLSFPQSASDIASDLRIKVRDYAADGTLHVSELTAKPGRRVKLLPAKQETSVGRVLSAVLAFIGAAGLWFSTRPAAFSPKGQSSHKPVRGGSSDGIADGGSTTKVLSFE